MEKTVYTVAEIKDILGIGRNFACEPGDGKAFPVRKAGKTILIPIETFNQWLYYENT